MLKISGILTAMTATFTFSMAVASDETSGMSENERICNKEPLGQGFYESCVEALNLLDFGLDSPEPIENSSNKAFEPDSSIKVLRGYDLGHGMIRFDVVAGRGGYILCVAFDAEGEPIATASDNADWGHVNFFKIELSAIDTVTCRYLR